MVEQINVRLTEEQCDNLQDKTMGQWAVLASLGLPLDAKMEIVEYTQPKTGTGKKIEDVLVRITYTKDDTDD